MRAGKRRSFITIEAPVSVKEKNASVSIIWQPYAHLWASIETLKGNERNSACASWPSADQKISFRYIVGVLPTMRVVFNNVIYSILNVNNVDERNRDIVLTTNSGVKAL